MGSCGNTPPRPDTVVLWDSAARNRWLGCALLVGGALCVGYAVWSGGPPVAWVFGAPLGIGAILLMVISYVRAETVTLSRSGLCVRRGKRVVSKIPAAAIRELVLAETGTEGRILELRMTYDTDLVPELPTAVRRFSELCGLHQEEVLRVLGGPTSPDTIPLGCVGSFPGGLTLETVFHARRLVEDTGLARWRRHTD